jgi:hypothetical protein
MIKATNFSCTNISESLFEAFIFYVRVLVKYKHLLTMTANVVFYCVSKIIIQLRKLLSIN